MGQLTYIKTDGIAAPFGYGDTISFDFPELYPPAEPNIPVGESGLRRYSSILRRGQIPFRSRKKTVLWKRIIADHPRPVDRATAFRPIADTRR